MNRIRVRQPNAFTLIEVILAIGLATALLLIALTFYHQAANLRTEILRSSQDLAAIRLSLDQIASDLRSATPLPSVSFIGGPTSVEFARVSPPSPKPRSTNSAFTVPTLQRLSIAALVSQNGTNLSVRGLTRSETPLFRPLPDEPRAPDPLDPLALSSRTPPEPASTNAPPETPSRPFTEAIHFLNFRYWNGASWQDSWFAPAPPPGIEITLGADPGAIGVGPGEVRSVGIALKAPAGAVTGRIDVTLEVATLDGETTVAEETRFFGPL